jgi:hypothetical protein
MRTVGSPTSRAWLLVPLLVLVACGTTAPTPSPTPIPPGRTVDDVELGAPARDCRPLVCESIEKAANGWLNRVASGHPEVTDIDLFNWVARDTNGDQAVVTFTTVVHAVVMTLADGTERATLVACGLGDCVQLDPFIADPPFEP